MITSITYAVISPHNKRETTRDDNSTMHCDHICWKNAQSLL